MSFRGILDALFGEEEEDLRGMHTIESLQALPDFEPWDSPELLPNIYAEKEESEAFEPTKLVFQPNQPSVLFPSESGLPYRGQEAAKRRLDIKIKAMGRKGRFKALLVGPAGTGKTALAWILADRILRQWAKRKGKKLKKVGRFFEILPAQMESKADLDVFMSQLRKRDVVFLDEVHVLQQTVGPEALFHTLADTGAPRYPLGKGGGWIQVPPTVSWIAATTDPGRLDSTTGGALRRRFGTEIRLDAPSQDELVQILLDQDRRLSIDVAWDIAERSGGLPWQALQVWKEARDIANVRSDGKITEAIAKQAFGMMGLDENGLMPEDHAVLRALLRTAPHTLATGVKRFKMSETALCAASGVDRGTYKDRVQPKLMQLGLLSVVGGQTLTEKALESYAYLR